MKQRRISKKKPEGIGLYKAILLLICIILLTAGIVSIVYSTYEIVNFRQYPIYLNVSRENDIGFDVRSNALSFGRIPQGATGVIKINVSNNFPKPLRVIMQFDGDAQQFIKVSMNNFFLEPNQTATIQIYAAIPKNQTLGAYTGKMEIFFKRH